MLPLNSHNGETCWIVGKGPSLKYLKREHIGDGPIIAIYEAVVPIELLEFPNKVYSLQKDGGLDKKYPFTVSNECDFRQCDFCKGIVKPKRATLLLHELEAKYCFEGYPDRYVFTLEEIGMPHNEFSLVCALKIGQYFGCAEFAFVSCDAHSQGDYGNIFPVMRQDYYDHIYKVQRSILPKYLEGVHYRWVTPS